MGFFEFISNPLVGVSALGMFACLRAYRLSKTVRAQRNTIDIYEQRIEELRDNWQVAVAHVNQLQEALEDALRVNTTSQAELAQNVAIQPTVMVNTLELVERETLASLRAAIRDVHLSQVWGDNFTRIDAMLAPIRTEVQRIAADRSANSIKTESEAQVKEPEPQEPKPFTPRHPRRIIESDT